MLAVIDEIICAIATQHRVAKEPGRRQTLGGEKIATRADATASGLEQLVGWPLSLVLRSLVCFSVNVCLVLSCMRQHR